MKNSDLNGVIGVVSNNPLEVDLAIKNKLDCVEIRADLLINKGYTISEICESIKNSRLKNLFCLFTLRHQMHGGKFNGTEEERIKIFKLAIESGANCIDLEWGTEAELVMHKQNYPLVISNHDFHSMPSVEELDKLTMEIEEHDPLAIKVVPTALKISDSVRILNWVKKSAKENILRIGFAMGSKGLLSRILSTIYGSPITYATFGDAVAPGQISMEKIINLYRVPELERDCLIFGVAGEDINDSGALILMNEYLKKKDINAVSVPLEVTNFDELIEIGEDLNICGMQLEYPLKEIAIQKFPEIGNSIEASLFLEFVIDKGEKICRFFNSSGHVYLKKKYK